MCLETVATANKDGGQTAKKTEKIDRLTRARTGQVRSHINAAKAVQ